MRSTAACRKMGWNRPVVNAVDMDDFGDDDLDREEDADPGNTLETLAG